uniref:agamous-like MADS-box protein AP3 n=1 Tax=Erigeron canadensis TaxID=72917 RepID=UPI001CB91CAE|nr:agamous-like MADS-box protein AP3 [Erigeron canadensis]
MPKGKRKIVIKKIEKNKTRQVAFSKRRTGLFKKASELCVLTGARVAILVKSPGEKVFAFGHPNADVLIDRYLGHDNNKNNAVTQHSVPPLAIDEYNQHYVQVSRELEIEKKRKVKVPVSQSGAKWYEEPVEEMNDVVELEQYLSSLVELRKKVETRADELMMIKTGRRFLSTSNVSEICSNNASEICSNNVSAIGSNNPSVLGWNNNGVPTLGQPSNANVNVGPDFDPMMIKTAPMFLSASNMSEIGSNNASEICSINPSLLGWNNNVVPMLGQPSNANVNVGPDLDPMMIKTAPRFFSTSNMSEIDSNNASEIGSNNVSEIGSNNSSVLGWNNSVPIVGEPSNANVNVGPDFDPCSSLHGGIDFKEDWDFDELLNKWF